MEVVGATLRKFVNLDLSCCLICIASWAVFFISEPPRALDDGSCLWFAAVSGVISFLLLKLCGYFSPFRVLPRKSDLLTVISVICLTGVVQHSAAEIFVPRYVGSLGVVLLLSPFVGTLVFSGHHFICWIALTCGARRRVAAAILPLERVALENELTKRELISQVELLGLNELKAAILRRDELKIDMIIISRGVVSRFEEDAALIRAHLHGIKIVDYIGLMTSISARIRLSEVDLWSYLVSATRQTPTLRLFGSVKFILEPLLALLLAVLLSPCALIVAALIKLSSKGPVLYTQNRVGYLGKHFLLYKFRSMRVDAEAAGPRWSSRNDDRVTGFGKFMRKTRLDELPQLLNVIKGEMSFIGPRPERPEIYQQLKSEIPLFTLRTYVRPGITGWAQVHSGYAASVAECHTKLEYDLYYIQHLSPRLDLIAIYKTLHVVIFGDRAAQEVVVAAPTAALRT